MEFNLIKVCDEINFKKGELDSLKYQLSNLPIYQRIKEL